MTRRCVRIPARPAYLFLTCDSHRCDNQVKVLRAIPPIEREDTLLGQYVAANGKPGYLDDDTVPHNSVCPTYAATTLWIHNPRWEGVPFILKAGKGAPTLPAQTLYDHY